MTYVLKELTLQRCRGYRQPWRLGLGIWESSYFFRVLSSLDLVQRMQDTSKRVAMVMHRLTQKCPRMPAPSPLQGWALVFVPTGESPKNEVM